MPRTLLAPAAKIAYGVGVSDCNGLQRGITSAAVGAHGHFEPIIAAAEHAAKIQRGQEQPVADRNAVGEDIAADVIVRQRIRGEPKAEIVAPVCSAAVVFQPALIREGGALGSSDPMNAE